MPTLPSWRGRRADCAGPRNAPVCRPVRAEQPRLPASDRICSTSCYIRPSPATQEVPRRVFRETHQNTAARYDQKRWERGTAGFAMDNVDVTRGGQPIQSSGRALPNAQYRMPNTLECDTLTLEYDTLPQNQQLASRPIAEKLKKSTHTNKNAQNGPMKSNTCDARIQPSTSKKNKIAAKTESSPGGANVHKHLHHVHTSAQLPNQQRSPKVSMTAGSDQTRHALYSEGAVPWGTEVIEILLRQKKGLFRGSIVKESNCKFM